MEKKSIKKYSLISKSQHFESSRTLTAFSPFSMCGARHTMLLKASYVTRLPMKAKSIPVAADGLRILIQILWLPGIRSSPHIQRNIKRRNKASPCNEIQASDNRPLHTRERMTRKADTVAKMNIISALLT